MSETRQSHIRRLRSGRDSRRTPLCDGDSRETLIGASALRSTSQDRTHEVSVATDEVRRAHSKSAFDLKIMHCQRAAPRQDGNGRILYSEHRSRCPVQRHIQRPCAQNLERPTTPRGERAGPGSEGPHPLERGCQPTGSSRCVRPLAPAALWWMQSSSF